MRDNFLNLFLNSIKYEHVNNLAVQPEFQSTCRLMISGTFNSSELEDKESLGG